SQGHRFLGESVEITVPEKYESLLNKQSVIPDRAERQNMIIEQIHGLCKQHNWAVPALESELLEEVTDLVEYPTAFYGHFDEEYLKLPRVVLETSMIDHQRYFPVRDGKDTQALLPYFISIRNGNSEHIEIVARGKEKVLTARLADAKLLYADDQDTEIIGFIETVKIIDVLADYFAISGPEIKELKEIAAIYKFDLVTQIVDEFPTLQGTIGGIYAKEHHLSDEIADAISEQYLPLSQVDPLPSTK